MANSLSKTGIITANTVRAWHVTQSIDAFNGAEAYDIILSGSLTYTDGSEGINKVLVDSNGSGLASFSSTLNVTSITSSLQGTASYAVNSLSAATASYAGSYLPLAGGTMTGNVLFTNGIKLTAADGLADIQLAANGVTSLTTDGGTWAEGVIYMDSAESSFGFNYTNFTIDNGFRAKSSQSLVQVNTRKAFESIDNGTVLNTTIGESGYNASTTHYGTFTATGNISGSEFSGSTYYGDGSNLTGILPYVGLYTGQITQVTTGAPTVVIPANGNTIGEVVWTRANPGEYRGTLTGAFSDVTICSIVQAPKLASSKVPSFIQMGRMTDDYVEIRVYDYDGITLSDSRLEDASFRIETWTA